MPYTPSYGSMQMPQQSQPSNNLWVGNNYSGGYSQQNRSMASAFPTYPTYPTPQQNTQTPVSNVLQVMGPESALAYQIAPNSHVILMDANKPVFYMKHSDDSGYSETKAYEFHEISLTQEPNSVQNSQMDLTNYVTKDELNEFKKTIEDLVMSNA